MTVEFVRRTLASYPADFILILLDGHSSMRSWWDNANDIVDGGRDGCRELGRELRREPVRVLGREGGRERDVSPGLGRSLFSILKFVVFFKLTFSFENIFQWGTF